MFLAVVQRSIYGSSSKINSCLSLSKHFTDKSNSSFNLCRIQYYSDQSLKSKFVSPQQILKAKMATARQAGKTLDDILYPDLEPYKTGMLQVDYN